MAVFDIRKAPPTQRFLDFQEIKDGAIVLKSGGLRAVLMANSINFALKNADEQKAIIFSFQNFINSLEFPLQIVVVSRQINLDNYLDSLEELARKQQNDLLKLQTQEYLHFIESLIELSNIISKYFYIVIPFAPIESQGGFLNNLFRGLGRTKYSKKQFENLKNQLWQRVKHVQIGLQNLQIKAEPLNTEELIELMFNLYNPEGKMKQTKGSVLELTGSREIATAPQ
jgi:hypothetical protein